MSTSQNPGLGYIGKRGAGSRHLQWLASFEREIKEEYERLHQIAGDDPQYAGHGGEGTWARLLNEWLPPNYEAATRKYILPEEGDDAFESDIVIFRPSYPKPLRVREEVLAGGVAAAFSVKLTVTADGIRDAYERAARIKSKLKPRIGSPRSELLGPFPYGLLAHSHAWKAPGSEPTENVTRNALLAQESVEIAAPREALDYICVADLGTWCEMRIPYIPPAFAMADLVSPRHAAEGYAMTALTAPSADGSTSGIASLVAFLFTRLSYSDPELLPMADGFRLTGTLGAGSGKQRQWDLDEVFSERVVSDLPFRSTTGWGEWGISANY